jgi:hypothetical protein
MVALPQPNMQVITNSAHTLLEEIPKIANIPAIQGTNAILDAIHVLGQRIDGINGLLNGIDVRLNGIDARFDTMMNHLMALSV